jgi:hypothetical protein
VSIAARRVVVWLILLTVPVQGLAALMIALQGAAHHHAIDSTPARQAVHSPASPSHHTHEQVRRHYHLPGEAVAVVNDEQSHDHAAAQSRNSEGEPATAAFVAMISGPPQFHPPTVTGGVAMGSPAKLQSCSLRRFERPPRILPA